MKMPRAMTTTSIQPRAATQAELGVLPAARQVRWTSTPTAGHSSPRGSGSGPAWRKRELALEDHRAGRLRMLPAGSTVTAQAWM